MVEEPQASSHRRKGTGEEIRDDFQTGDSTSNRAIAVSDIAIGEPDGEHFETRFYFGDPETDYS